MRNKILMRLVLHFNKDFFFVVPNTFIIDTILLADTAETSNETYIDRTKVRIYFSKLLLLLNITTVELRTLSV